MYSYGAIVREQVNPLTKAHLNIDAHTRDSPAEEEIRPLLEIWGKMNEETISGSFFEGIPEKACCPRLMTLTQVVRWKAKGGSVVLLQRPSAKPTSFEKVELTKILENKMVDHRILNVTKQNFDQTILDLIK